MEYNRREMEGLLLGDHNSGVEITIAARMEKAVCHVHLNVKTEGVFSNNTSLVLLSFCILFCVMQKTLPGFVYHRH